MQAFLVKLLIKDVKDVHIFLLFIIILYIKDIISAFWRYKKQIWAKALATRTVLLCHWNLNSITAYNFLKMSLLQAYNFTCKFDIICLSETYLDTSYYSDDNQLHLPGYNIIRPDNPNNIEAGVCIYY